MEVIDSRWLCRDDDLSWTVCGIKVDPATRTRREEYTFAASMAQGTLLLDAATGYVPGWHLLPYILTNVPVPRTVIACDVDPRQAQMPGHPAVVRMHGNLCCLPYLDAQFDSTFCISTLEHLEPAERMASAKELLRVTKPGGRLVLTADLGWWLPSLFGFPVGSDSPDEPTLSPAVYVLAFTK